MLFLIMNINFFKNIKLIILKLILNYKKKITIYYSLFKKK